jgi:hypothetical protein
MHKGIALLQVLYNSTGFGRMRPSSGVVVTCKAATMVFLNFSSGGSCVGSGGVETCCSRGSHVVDDVDVSDA